MRIDELKRIAKENDYKPSKSLVDCKFKRKNSDNCITISSRCRNRIWSSIQGHCDDKDFNMIKAAIEYAETDPDDREEEKKFYLRHRYLVGTESVENNFLNYDDYFDRVFLESEDTVYKTQFTRKEIEEIKEKFDTDLADFELVEVEDED